MMRAFVVNTLGAIALSGIAIAGEILLPLPEFDVAYACVLHEEDGE
jgi:hypothetical protein